MLAKRIITCLDMKNSQSAMEYVNNVKGNTPC